MKLFVVGAGRVGRVVIQLMSSTQHEVVGAANSSADGAEATHNATGIKAQFGSGVEIDPEVECVWFTVPDRTIGAMANDLWDRGQLSPHQILVHASGALPAAVLREAAPGVRSVASAHPFQSFMGTDVGIANARTALWFLEGEPDAVKTVTALLEEVGANPRPQSAHHRAAYHAAAVLASNALVALADTASEIMERAGFERDDALGALVPLLEGTLQNLRDVGLPDALTGPIARGDAETVRNHLAALREVSPEVLPLYRVMGYRTLNVARDLGMAPSEALDAVQILLSELD